MSEATLASRGLVVRGTFIECLRDPPPVRSRSAPARFNFGARVRNSQDSDSSGSPLHGSNLNDGTTITGGKRLL